MAGRTINWSILVVGKGVKDLSLLCQELSVGYILFQCLVLPALTRCCWKEVIATTGEYFEKFERLMSLQLLYDERHRYVS